jgi:hypothetical protein
MHALVEWIVIFIAAANALPNQQIKWIDIVLHEDFLFFGRNPQNSNESPSFFLFDDFSLRQPSILDSAEVVDSDYAPEFALLLNHYDIGLIPRLCRKFKWALLSQSFANVSSSTSQVPAQSLLQTKNGRFFFLSFIFQNELYYWFEISFFEF